MYDCVLCKKPVRTQEAEWVLVLIFISLKDLTGRKE